MGLRLNGSTSGYVELNAPAVAGSQSLTVPDDLKAWNDLGQTNFSGSSVTLSAIDTDARVIRIVFADMSVNNTSTPQLRLRLGNGSESSTGYDYSISYAANNQSSDNQSYLNLIHTDFNNASNTWQGNIDILSSQTYMVVVWQMMSITGSGQCVNGAGKWRGGSAIDRINLSTGSTFDNGHFAVYTLN